MAGEALANAVDDQPVGPHVHVGHDIAGIAFVLDGADGPERMHQGSAGFPDQVFCNRIIASPGRMGATRGLLDG